jgi:3-deoxy-D-manno-octulosonate 8-phosphate phosphatase (KDO 8-P phosphatase)
MNDFKQLDDIRLVLFDVDGVMTDGTIIMSEQGEVLKAFNVKDGLAIELLRSHGILSGVISGKASPALSKRCQQLGFDIVITGCKNKLPQLTQICQDYQLTLKDIAFCGDDVLDLPIMEICGLGAAPCDAHQLVLESADWVMSKKGGEGMVREFVDTLLCKQLNLNLRAIYAKLMADISNNDVAGIQQ